jgi:hypothetical protein
LMYTVGGTVAAPTLTYNPTFGSLTNGNNNYFVFTPRQVQIALRYSFLTTDSDNRTRPLKRA